MFSFKRSGSSKKGTDSNTSLHGGEKGEAAAPSDPGAAPIEPPTPSPYHPDKSATLPLVVENSPTTTFSASESVKKLETTGMVKTDSTAAGGGQAAKPVAVGKSSRAPTLRLREGSRVQVEGLKAKGLGDIGSKFFTFGAKKEPDLFVRFSMGSMIPPCRTKAVAKTKQTCDWGDEVVEFIVTEEITRLVGSDLKLTVQLYWEGQKGNDALVGGAVVDMSDHLNQGSCTVPIMEGKKAKGELSMNLTYLLPGLLAEQPVPEGSSHDAVTPLEGAGDEALPPADPAPVVEAKGAAAAAAGADNNNKPPAGKEGPAPDSKKPPPLATNKEAPAVPKSEAAGGGGSSSPQPPPQSGAVPSKEEGAAIAKSPAAGGTVPQPVATEGPRRVSNPASPSVQQQPAPITAAEGGGRPAAADAAGGSSKPGELAKAASPSATPTQAGSVPPPVVSPSAAGGGVPGPVVSSPSSALEAVRRLSSDKSGRGSPRPSSPRPALLKHAEGQPGGAEALAEPIAVDAGQGGGHATSSAVTTPVAIEAVAGGKPSQPVSPAAPPLAAVGGPKESGKGGPQPAAAAAAAVVAASPVSETAVEGLQVTQELAQHMLSRVKEAASLPQDGGGAVRRMMDKVKEGVTKELQPADGATPSPRPAQPSNVSPRRASLKLELSSGPAGKAAAVPATPLLSPSPFVDPRKASAAAPPAASKPVEATPTQPAGPMAPPVKPTGAMAAAAAGGGGGTAEESKSDAAAKDKEEEDSVLMGTAGKTELTLTEVLRSMPEEDEDDEEAFMLGLRPPAKGPGQPQRGPLDKDEAVTKLQAAWRRKAVSRDLRRQQLHARRIQSLFRGHKDRREFQGRLAVLKKLENEERRRQERQRRLMVNQRELALLRLTPAMELGLMDQRRREFAARRIQHFVRKRLRAARQRKRKPSVKSPSAGAAGRATIPVLIDTTDEEEAVQDFVSTYKRSCLSPRSYGGGPLSPRRAQQQQPQQEAARRAPPLKRRLSAIRLADLHRKVMSTSKAKDKRDVMEKFESALSMGVRAVHAAKNPQSGAQVRYQRLLESRYEARLLLSARQDDEEDRTDSTASRRERVGRFRQLLDQLEAPPKLSDLREAFGLDEPEGAADQPPRELKAVPDIVLPWRLPRNGQAVQLAEKAHRHALETMQEKQSRWWVTPLPEDLAEPPVDVRHVQAPPPFLSENLDPQDDPFLVPGLGGFDEDEASLWWYAYARKNVAGPKQAVPAQDDTGPGVGDILFQRARLGRPVLREKNMEDLRSLEAVEQGSARDLVKIVMRERKRRLAAAALAREAEARKAEAKRKEDEAAVRIQSAYRGSAVRKQVLSRRP